MGREDKIVLHPYQVFILDKIPKDFIFESEDITYFSPVDVLLFYANLQEDELLRLQLVGIVGRCFFPDCIPEIAANQFADEMAAMVNNGFLPRDIGYFLTAAMVSTVDSGVEDIAEYTVTEPVGIASRLVDLYTNGKSERSLFLLSELRDFVDLSWKYAPILGKSKCKFTFLNAVELNNPTGACVLGGLIMQKEQTKIYTCENCGNYFVPVSRSDEKFCCSCRRLGYDNRIQNDPIKREYRKIYQKQCMRKNRNSHLPNIESKYKEWCSFAKGKLQDCQNGTISLDEMVSAISGTEWMKGG